MSIRVNTPAENMEAIERRMEALQDEMDELQKAYQVNAAKLLREGGRTTAGLLIDALSVCAPDTLIVLSSDSEGNIYSPLGKVEGNVTYIADSDSSGSVYLTELTDELREQGFTEADIAAPGRGVPAIILYPVN